jgi:hypothetical protein
VLCRAENRGGSFAPFLVTPFRHRREPFFAQPLSEKRGHPERGPHPVQREDNNPRIRTRGPDQLVDLAIELAKDFADRRPCRLKLCDTVFCIDGVLGLCFVPKVMRRVVHFGERDYRELRLLLR